MVRVDIGLWLFLIMIRASARARARTEFSEYTAKMNMSTLSRITTNNVNGDVLRTSLAMGGGKEEW